VQLFEWLSVSEILTTWLDVVRSHIQKCTGSIFSQASAYKTDVVVVAVAETDLV